MEKYRYEKSFEIGFCDVDFKDELKPSALLSLLEEVACSSAEELGFGYPQIKPKGYAFMVTEIRFDVVRLPLLREKVKVVTWPTPPTYVVFGREYAIYAENGDLLVCATSKWCLIDFKSGKILTSKMLSDQDYTTYNTDRSYTGDERKIGRFTLEEGTERFCMTVANSEYDHNLHVNNTRYADYCFNCFSVDELASCKLSSFAISYVKQCKENERLRFYRKGEEDGVLLCGFNELGETVLRAKAVFKQ